MDAGSQSPQGQNATSKQRKRSRWGCQNCRRKKKKCDEIKPTCSACARTLEHCVWGAPLKFRSQNELVRADHLLYSTTRGEKRAALSQQVVRSHREPAEPPSGPSGRETGDTESTDGGINQGQHTVVDVLTQTPEIDKIHHDYLYPDPLQMPDIPATSLYSDLNRTSSHGSNILPLSPDSHRGLPTNARQFTFDALTAGDATLGSLDFSGINSVSFDDGTTASAPDITEFQPSPDIMTDDGIFLPGSRYQELHNTLRDHVFNTARSTKPSRTTSPTRHFAEATEGTSDNVISNADSPATSTQPAETPIRSPIAGLTPHREYVLWKNWVEEISAWLDKFDAHKHFRHTLPVMAKTCPHLRYSMIALSARQLERKDKSIPSSLTLAIYQEAIHLLIPQLPNKHISVVASCVILCVLEMLSCSPKAWRRHLDGCASLIRSMHIHGNGTGLEKSLFWCFARMDVCGGLISTEKTLIPINEWMSTPTLEADCAEFRTSKIFEDHANYSCYLLARVLAFLIDSERLSHGSPQSYPKEQQFYAQKWIQLFDLLEDWSETRPPEMQALLTQGARSSGSDHPVPFPTLLFGNGAAISGNQQYHTACLLMLQRIPRNVRKKPRSTLWHARQICGISITNAHHGCWTNSVQPLWLAGQVMSHPSEHQAIVAIYERIERETGWGATWRAEDLKQHWGELSE